jgi:hypothetical protein
MWLHESRIEVEAPAAAVWARFADVAGWKRWNAGVAECVLHGAFVDDGEFDMRLPDGTEFRSRLFDVVDGRCFADETQVGEHRVRVWHRIDALDDARCRVAYQAEVEGPDAAGVGDAVAGDFGDVLAALKREAEAQP